MKVNVSVPFSLRVVVYPAPDLPGEWIAHGLETDIVTQGDSIEHAMHMMADAIGTLAEYSAEQGLFPIRLVPAPREVWDLVGVARPSGILADVAVTPASAKKGRAKAKVPSSYSLYAFVSENPPRSAHAS